MIIRTLGYVTRIPKAQLDARRPSDWRAAGFPDGDPRIRGRS
jgi:hypothetical protein